MAVKNLKIRPYARLLTMLGEQLIKNERIALIEIIKNSYDADAEWVKISFSGFDDNYNIQENSKIVIEDDGLGMTEDIIVNHWLNPATPEKKRRKRIKETTSKGRIIQGEKGIGRFALLKLGKKIKVTTRPENQDIEHLINYDFSNYDDDFLSENGEEKDLYLDDLVISVESRKPTTIITKPVSIGIRRLERNNHGTKIEISDLKGNWSENKINKVYQDISHLRPIFGEINNSEENNRNDFEVYIYKNNKFEPHSEKNIEKIKNVLENNPVIKVEDGLFDNEKYEYRFKINGEDKKIKIFDPSITGLTVFKNRFGVGGKALKKRDIECGSFNFQFFIFDLSVQAPAKYQLDREEKKLIKNHRVYLYRDGIRVYPYGDPNDDWLQIDTFRGTIGAGHFLSNDQLVGVVNITQKENPKLMDKTNREGLIEEGDITEDFIALIQTFLMYIRLKPFARYRQSLKDKSAQDIFRTKKIQNQFASLKNKFKNNEGKINFQSAINLISQAEKAYITERRYLVQRAEATEELAAVGLSVETTSHDVMAMIDKAMNLQKSILKDILHQDYDINALQNEMHSLLGMLEFIDSELHDIQLLFKSSKQRRKKIKVKELLDKVERIYKRLLKDHHITFTIAEIGSPLIVKTTDAVILQLLINLIDNSIYWLQQVDRNEKKISIHLNGNNGQMIFSDNGPGVDKEDEPYIFEPFYSGKGEEGRGLGLYIAKQLLERSDYTIYLGDIKSEKLLEGANFVVSFVAEDSNGI